MNESILLLAILIPAAAGVLALVSPPRLREAVTLAATGANLGLAVWLWGKPMSWSAPWGGYGIDFVLRSYPFSAFILACVAGFALLVALYSLPFMWTRAHARQYYGCFLLTVAMANGAILADHLIVLLFFWEALLAVVFGMIAIGRKGAYKTAIKMFVIVGITDLCMMLGMAITYWKAGTGVMSAIHLSPDGAVTGLAMILMMIGAMGKAGCMPFHTWIPDAAEDAPLPFMAILPASLEKLLGIYFLARISLDLFALSPQSWISTLLMIVGAATIVLAVSMALVQKDYKRLLSYHAISQVGYMVLGIGTAVPVGIVGGLFHMLNNAMYKSCLFLTGGSVEKQAGTTDLARLGGLAARMPITFACFAVAAASISGVPPFNGFFSKELVYDGALQRGTVFYAAALIGSVLTAASFLKLGHAAFGGRRDPAHEQVREAPAPMLVPMIVLAGLCVVFGLWNALPLNLIAPVIGERAQGHEFSGWPHSVPLVALTVAALAAAVLNHLWGARRTGSGLHAVDHIHHAPILAGIYDKAQRRWFDPYDLGMTAGRGLVWVGWATDRVIDWIFSGLGVALTKLLSWILRLCHTGSYAMYVMWCLLGAAAVIWILTK